MNNTDRNAWVDDPAEKCYTARKCLGGRPLCIIAASLILWCVIAFVMLVLSVCSGCQASTTIKGGHSEASNTTNSLKIKVDAPPVAPVVPAPAIKIKIGPRPVPTTQTEYPAK